MNVAPTRLPRTMMQRTRRPGRPPRGDGQAVQQDQAEILSSYQVKDAAGTKTP